MCWCLVFQWSRRFLTCVWYNAWYTFVVEYCSKLCWLSEGLPNVQCCFVAVLPDKEWEKKKDKKRWSYTWILMDLAEPSSRPCWVLVLLCVEELGCLWSSVRTLPMWQDRRIPGIWSPNAAKILCNENWPRLWFPAGKHYALESGAYLTLFGYRKNMVEAKNKNQSTALQQWIESPSHSDRNNNAQALVMWRGWYKLWKRSTVEIIAFNQFAQLIKENLELSVSPIAAVVTYCISWGKPSSHIRWIANITFNCYEIPYLFV